MRETDVRKSRLTEEQIIKVLKKHAAGLSAREVCRKYGISDATFYKWRSRYGGMGFRAQVGAPARQPPQAPPQFRWLVRLMT